MNKQSLDELLKDWSWNLVKYFIALPTYYRVQNYWCHPAPSVISNSIKSQYTSQSRQSQYDLTVSHIWEDNFSIACRTFHYTRFLDSEEVLNFSAEHVSLSSPKVYDGWITPYWWIAHAHHFTLLIHRVVFMCTIKGFSGLHMDLPSCWNEPVKVTAKVFLACTSPCVCMLNACYSMLYWMHAVSPCLLCMRGHWGHLRTSPHFWQQIQTSCNCLYA
jgi:hypothetical protein